MGQNKLKPKNCQNWQIGQKLTKRSARIGNGLQNGERVRLKSNVCQNLWYSKVFCLACVTTKRSFPEFTSQTRKASHSEDVEVTLCEGSLPTWDLQWTSIVSYSCRDICERISIWTKTAGNLGVSMILLMVQKSQTATWDVQNPVNNRIVTVSTGAGFLPSTVCVSKIYNQVSMTWLKHPPAPCPSYMSQHVDHPS